MTPDSPSPPSALLDAGGDSPSAPGPDVAQALAAARRGLAALQRFSWDSKQASAETLEAFWTFRSALFDIEALLDPSPPHRQYFSGICQCGHAFDDHHLGMIMNRSVILQLPPGHPPYLAQECEYFGCNETGGLGPDGEPHCERYVDRDDPRAQVPRPVAIPETVAPSL